jgi:hypothetical protein
LAINEQIELFSGGFKLGTGWKIRIPFVLYQNLTSDVYAKDMPSLHWTNRDYLGKSFNLGDLSLRAEMLSVHVGFHKNVTDRLILGAELKFI